MAAAAPGRHACHPHALLPAAYQGATCTACTARKARPDPGFAPPLLCQHALLQVCSLHISLTVHAPCIPHSVWVSTHTALPIFCDTHVLRHLMSYHPALQCTVRPHQQQKGNCFWPYSVYLSNKPCCMIADHCRPTLEAMTLCHVLCQHHMKIWHPMGWGHPTCCDNAELIVHSAGARA